MNAAKMGRKRRIRYLNEPFLPFLRSQQNPLTQLEFTHTPGPWGNGNLKVALSSLFLGPMSTSSLG
jgi:hypothetical protein